MVKQIGIFYNLVFFKFGISKKYLVFYYLDLAFFIFWYFKVLVFYKMVKATPHLFHPFVDSALGS